MKKDKLLFFFSDDKCDVSAAVIPTLSNLAEAAGVDFETYICSRPKSVFGKVLPFVGHGHLESFYYLANFYKKIIFCSISSYESLQFKREIQAFDGDIVSCRGKNEVMEFYEDVFGYFNKELPSTAAVIPQKPNSDDELWIAPYCYPDIQNTGKLGITENVLYEQKDKLIAHGITKIDALYCDVKADGFDISLIDVINEGEQYKDVTLRILERNMEYAKGVGFADAAATFRWQVLYCRKNCVTLYQDYNWREFVPVVADYAKKLDNHTVIGNQVVYVERDNIIKGEDAVISLFAQHNVLMDLVGPNPRIGFTIQTEQKLEPDWLENVPAPWEEEYSDEYLQEKIDNGCIPVCFLFYAADLGHLPVLPKFLDMMSVEGMRAGIAFPSTWYDYQPEVLEQLYVPLDQGGVFPQLEPLLSSVGVAVATEAEGFIDPDFYFNALKQAKDDIAAHIGKRHVPVGYYPFQDSTPFYQLNAGVPQYDVVDKAGFEYYITYKTGGSKASVVYESDTMTVLNQQLTQWYPWGPSSEKNRRPLDYLKKWEGAYTKMEQPGWITLSFDTPFYGLTPNYLGQSEYEKYRNIGLQLGMNYLFELMYYVKNGGGDTGKLFMLKPHELYRYAKLLRKQGKL